MYTAGTAVKSCKKTRSGFGYVPPLTNIPNKDKESGAVRAAYVICESI